MIYINKTKKNYKRKYKKVKAIKQIKIKTNRKKI